MAKKHAQTYGNLGIGVDREYVIKRHGNPVFYLVNGEYSNLGACARKVIDYLKPNSKEALAEIQVIVGYFKKMSEQNSSELIYYDELEWRIVHLTRLEQRGLIIPQDEKNYIYRIKLSKEDVKVIVFPDEKTKALALSTEEVTTHIDKPICVTIEDCENF